MSPVAPGARNLITDVPGLAVGNAHDSSIRSGVTVLLPDAPAVAAVDVRGGGSGSRETALLEPSAMVRHVDALVLSGGSAFGLDAAGGVMSWLAARGRGFAAGTAVVPIVPQAILFDLLNGGDKTAFRTPDGAGLPYRALAATACDSAAADVVLGNSGAGYGASSGSLKGGLGSASAVLPDGPGGGATVGALVAVNSFGETVTADGAFWAWESEIADEFGGRGAPAGRPEPLAAAFAVAGMPGTNTTIAIVATDLELTQGEARRVAVMAQDGLARAIRPVHTPYDGDTVFALATGRRAAADDTAVRTAAIMRVGTLAADCLARAVARGIFAAETLGDMVSWRARFG
ncbi:MAG: P1 family peptidase [Alphaproteobacteria bacterium]|jgi:L-aminopeptidase/D-esterase-like protein